MVKILILISLLLLSCTPSKQPLSITNTNNKDIQVELIFEHKGCRVYGFDTGHRYIFYTDCNSTHWVECQLRGKVQECNNIDVNGKGK